MSLDIVKLLMMVKPTVAVDSVSFMFHTVEVPTNYLTEDFLSLTQSLLPNARIVIQISPPPLFFNITFSSSFTHYLPIDSV
jgi:hypothetical protein